MDNRSIFSLSLQKEADGKQIIQRRCLPGRGGRMIVKSVAGSPRNGWPNQREISGRMGVKFASMRWRGENDHYSGQHDT
jgi:hypothetical protein